MGEFRTRWVLLACALCVCIPALGERVEDLGCFVEWGLQSLTVGNGHFERRYAPGADAALVTRGLRRGDGEWIEVGRTGPVTGRLSVSVRRAKWSVVGAEGLEATVAVGTRTFRIWIFPEVPGVLLDAPDAADPLMSEDRGSASNPRYGLAEELAERQVKGCDVLRLKPLHLKMTEFVLRDMTDIRDTIYEENTWLLMTREAPLLIRSNVVSVEDTLTGEGLAFLRLAPLAEHRCPGTADFVFGTNGERYENQNEIWMASVANGYPVFELAYAGGRPGRIAALVAAQRALRSYRPDRDGRFLTNTWGDSNRDKRITADFMLQEIAAGAELGVDVVQVDDGWQKGKSANSALITNRSQGAWADFRRFDPHFWNPDPVRFPQGLAPVVRAAKKRGLDFGLWFGPSSSDDCAAWEQDAETLLDFWRKDGIRYFKIDAIHMETERSFARQRSMFTRMLESSSGDMTFDLDVTGVARRPGYFGLPETGPLFVENRYWHLGRYWPHCTLRNLWSLAQVIDPVRLRMEVLNPRHGIDQYPDSPLAPSRYRADTLFATVMVSSPLGWFETSELGPENMSEMKPLVAAWKRERPNLHGGVTVPVAARPDGVSWTGFLTRGADGVSAYALLFRELASEESFELDLASLGPCFRATSCAVIGGRGTAQLESGVLKVTIPRQLDFIWVKLTGSCGAQTIPEPRNVPELMRTFDGRVVADVETWEKVRRPELMKEFLEKFYGVRPMAAERPQVCFLEERPEQVMLGGQAIRKMVRIAYRGPYGTNSFVATCFIPKSSKTVSAFVLICNRRPDENLDPERVKKSGFWPVEEIVGRGYAAIAFFTGDVAPDNYNPSTAFLDGVFPCYEHPEDRDDRSWGALSAWAWGASRVMDWIETEPLLDAKRVAVVGHSRGGKASLLAGATDDRFAMACVNDSGCGGVKLCHIDLPASEHYHAFLCSRVTYWYCPAFQRYAIGKDIPPYAQDALTWWYEPLRVDQHEWAAMVAPRLLAVGSATLDDSAGQPGEFHAVRLASPAWKLYGKKGIPLDAAFPAPDSPIVGNDVSYHLRTGKHDLTPYDWKVYMDFADAHGWRK